jgi:hypothetical protein
MPQACQILDCYLILDGTALGTRTRHVFEPSSLLELLGPAMTGKTSFQEEK